MAEPAPVPEPRANPTLVGHGTAEAAMRQAFETGRTPHAWLITGPRGVGKATLAYRFARFVLAGGAAQAELLGGAGPAAGGLAIEPSHPLFRRVAVGAHADLLTITRGRDLRGRERSEIVVGDARRLGAFLALTPAEGGWRVAIIDAADEMNRNAANAVLKLVEEPPRKALILLVCHVPGRVPGTLRSRCRRIALEPLADAEVAALLESWRADIGASDRAALCRLADGCPGRALVLAELDAVNLYRELVGLIATVPGIDARALHGFGDRLARRGAEAAFTATMELLTGWLARMVTADARGAAFDEVVPGEAETAARLLAARGLDRWLELWEKIADLAQRTGRANLDRKQVVLSVFTALERTARV